MSYGWIPLGAHGATRVGQGSSVVLVLVDNGRAPMIESINQICMPS